MHYPRCACRNTLTRFRYTVRKLRPAYWFIALIWCAILIIVGHQVFQKITSPGIIMILLATALLGGLGLIAAGLEGLMYVGLLFPFVLYLGVLWISLSIAALVDLCLRPSLLTQRKNQIALWVLGVDMVVLALTLLARRYLW